MRYYVYVESIKRLRKAMGVSLTEMAQRTGLHREAIARIEHPDTDPRASSLATVAKALGVPVCRFFQKEDEHERHRSTPGRGARPRETKRLQPRRVRKVSR